MDCLSRMSILWGHADTEAYADFYMAYKNGFVMACDYFAPQYVENTTFLSSFSVGGLHVWNILSVAVP